jgi:hypothetical protein
LLSEAIEVGSTTAVLGDVLTTAKSHAGSQAAAAVARYLLQTEASLMPDERRDRSPFGTLSGKVVYIEFTTCPFRHASFSENTNE